MPHQGTQQTASSAAEINGSILEHRPSTDLPKADEMFLSPRVLDAGAFGRYAELLKSIIAKASTEGRTLEDFCTDAEHMVTRTNEVEQSLNTRLQAGVRMLRMIDERADRTDQLLDKVRQNLPDAGAIDSQIDQAINARIEQTQARIDAMLQAAEAKAADAEQRAHRAAAKTEQESIKLAQAVREAEQHIGSIEQRIAETVLQADKSVNDLDQHASVNKAILEQTLEKSLAQASAVGASLADRVNEASKLTDERIANLNASIVPLTNAAEQAMRTLGIDPSNPRFEDSPFSRVESLVQRAETQTAAVDRVFAQLDDLRSQAEHARTEFGHWLIDAAGQLDTLEDRKDDLAGPINQAAARIAEIAPDLEDKLELASTKLGHLQLEQQTLRETIHASSSVANRATERLENQSGQLQALLDGSMHKLTQRVEQAGVWLGSLITRAEQTGQPLQPNQPAPVTAPPPEQAASETVARIQSTPAAEPPVQRAAPTPPTPAPTRTTTIATPQPPQLPIDAFSFDGSADIIEHGD